MKPWILHIPHASTFIPADVRSELLLSDHDLAIELLRMTDHLTDELVRFTLPSAPRIRFPISRLVVDPERFIEDSDEPMSRVGMGVIYERTSKQRLLRRPPSPEQRQRLLEHFYAPHHAALYSATETALHSAEGCFLLDVHSFSSRPLPYEFDQRSDRPDICIGTDNFHTPKWLCDELARKFRANGLSVAINRPFAGALVPRTYYCRNSRVQSIMIEVNRGLYLDEETGKAGSHFTPMQHLIAEVFGDIRAIHRNDIPNDRTRPPGVERR